MFRKVIFTYNITRLLKLFNIFYRFNYLIKQRYFTSGPSAYHNLINNFFHNVRRRRDEYTLNLFDINFRDFKMNNECDLIPEEWVGFESEINPKLIKFKLDTVLQNDKRDRLSTGVIMNLDDIHMYTAFLSMKERPIDIDIIKANTYLSYDKLNSSFIMQGEDSLLNIFKKPVSI